MAERYARWVVHNRAAVSYAENALKGILFLLPGRLAQADVAYELAYAGVGILGLYHDLIFLRNLREQMKANPPSSSQLMKMIDATVVPENCERVLMAVSAVQHMELLLEMACRSYFSKKTRWSVIFVVELLKALCRLMLLARLKGRMLTYHSIPSRDDSADLTEKLTTPPVEADSASSPSLVAAVRPERIMPRKKRGSLLDHLRKGPVDSQQTPLSFQPCPVPPLSSHPHLLDSPLDAPTLSAILGELLYIVRPVVYVMAFIRFGKRSWKPWLLSLAIDFASKSLSQSADSLTPTQVEELRRRAWNLLYYLLRDPFFKTFTRYKFYPKVGVCSS